MTRHEASLVKGFLFFIGLLVLGIAVTVYTQMKTALPVKATDTISDTAPTIRTASVFSNTQISEADSSKADRKLILKATKNGSETTYAYSVADISGAGEQLIFSKTLGEGASLSLPVNAWDPTDTYIFVEEKNGEALTYYVLKANGESFANGEKFIDVGAIWAAKKIGYQIRTATGWASGTLLIIYTSKDDGSKGPSYWFEIPSTAIIQLAR